MKELSMDNLFIGGDKITGKEVREKNTKAILAIFNSIKTSFGPLGLDKMCVDSIGDVMVTNDGATILKNMDVEDPAARIMVELAQQQDTEVGDGTTGVVLLASALIERGNKLISSGLHPSIVVSGFKMAFKESVRFIRERLEIDTSKLGNKVLSNVVSTSISSKVIKTETEHFSKIIIEAIKSIESSNYLGNPIYNINDINILKKQGGGMADSMFLHGYALNCVPASTNMVKKIKNPKIICLDFDLQKIRMPLNVNIVIDSPDKLEDIRKRETDITSERIKKILDSGVNVILSTKGIDDLVIKQIVDKGAIGVRRCKKEDLLVIAKATGTTLIRSLADLDGNEVVSSIGSADMLSVETMGEDDCIFIHTPKKKMSSIILRGANEQLLDEMERSVHDALCVLKRTLESKAMLPAGGASECALSLFLDEFASSINSKEYVVVHKFAEALLTIPKLLTLNAGLDANELVANLISEQSKGNRAKKQDCFEYGIDVVKGVVQNNVASGLLEPSSIKLKALRAATEAAISILRIDEIIILPPEQKEERRVC